MAAVDRGTGSGGATRMELVRVSAPIRCGRRGSSVRSVRKPHRSWQRPTLREPTGIARITRKPQRKGGPGVFERESM